MPGPSHVGQPVQLADWLCRQLAPDRAAPPSLSPQSTSPSVRSGRGTDESDVADSSINIHPCGVCVLSTNLPADSLLCPAAPQESVYGAQSVAVLEPDGLQQDKFQSSCRIFSQVPL